MKILHIVSGLDPRSGGPTRSISGLCRSLAQAGVNTSLFVHSPAYDLANPGKVRFAKGRGNGLLTAWQDANRIMDEVQPDLIHLHGIWTLTNAVDAAVARKRQIPYVIAPRGMLEPWSLNAKRWKKRIALFLYQRRDLKRAVALHATADAEAAQLRKLGFEQPIIVSPNGVDIPAAMPPRSQRPNKKKTMLFLSRIHPKKGLTELVEACAKVRDTENLNWHIEYGGPDCNGHLAEVQKRIKELGVESDFTYLGNLNDEEKWTAYRRADLFVLPTYSENFGIVVAEALAAEVPVITTKGTPWSELQGNSDSSKVLKCESSKVCPSCDVGEVLKHGHDTVRDDKNDLHEVHTQAQAATDGTTNFRTLELQNFRTSRCGWWIDIWRQPLTVALREAMSLSDAERYAMGTNGRQLIEAKYTWPAIAEQMKQAYGWILNGGEQPCFVCEYHEP